MSGRDLVNDATFHDFVRKFAVCPVANGPFRVLRVFAGHRGDLADLISGDPRRTPRARQVFKTLFNAQIRQRNCLQGQPAISPPARSKDAYSKVFGDPGIVLAFIGS
jgi:hypothetical protein